MTVGASSDSTNKLTQEELVAHVRKVIGAASVVGMQDGLSPTEAMDAVHEACRKVLDPHFGTLPLQGRMERRHLYKWVAAEEEYVGDKFDDQRNGHDQYLREFELERFWFGQITQYLDRASAYMRMAAQEEPGSTDRKELQWRAQQAMAKCMMTAKGLVESSIRVWGRMPMPGVPSGTIQEWSSLG